MAGLRLGYAVAPAPVAKAIGAYLSHALGCPCSLSERAGIGQQTVTLLLKLIAMAYVTEFAVQACRDAGEDGLAGKAALCGKMLLMVQTLPLIREIGELTFSLIP